MGLLERVIEGRVVQSRRGEVSRYVPPAWMDPYFNMPVGLTTSYGIDRAELIADDFVSYVLGGLRGNGVVWSIERVRVAVFSEVRFQFQRFSKGRPADLYGTPELQLLERPWEGGTTGDLTSRMILDADMAGNFFGVEMDGEVVRLRPDWVEIVLTERYDASGMQVGWKRLGYLYYEGGKQGEGQNPAVFMPDEVVHFSPMPDPLATWRGMSWLTPVVREIMADTQATKHKLKFFENAAPQPLNAKILTPSGWSTMGEMTLGAKVIGSDGLPHRVTGVFPQGEQEIFRVRFADGGSTECTADHLWTVTNAYDRKRGVRRTLPLRALVEGDGRYGNGAGRGGLRMPSGAAKWAVPMVGPIDFDPQTPLPIDPYLLGLLLGDGSFRGNRRGEDGNVTLAAAIEDVAEVEESLRSALPDDMSFSRRDRGGWSEFYFMGPSGPFPGSLKEAIRDLGLWGKGSREKFIPRSYLTAGVKDRLALLQGLIDSDGSIDARQPNLVKYTTNSGRLAADVVELTCSLGGLASMAQHGGRDRWTVAVKRLPDEFVPARLLRKASRYRPSSAPRWRSIVAVEPVGVRPAQCIRVDVEDHLYVTDGYILTHNTPNLAISLPKEVSAAQFEEFVDKMDAKHKGADQAYKTLYTAGGADVTVVGANMHQLDFKVTQGAGESRLAAAGGIHPAIVGLSEGLQGSSLNAGNFGAARRLVADATMRPLWRNAAGSLEVLVPPPDATSRLWYDARDVAFLREDAMDEAKIMQIDAQTIGGLVRDGFTPESAKAAVLGRNPDLLQEIPGWVSVQLQPKTGTPPATDSTTPAPPANGSGG